MEPAAHQVLYSWRRRIYLRHVAPPRPLLRSALLAACGVLAAGFDIDAHDAVGQTAASAMDQKAVKEVKRLLNGQDASDVAGWGHQVDDTFPGMERLHFQAHNEPFCQEYEKRSARCDDNICLMASIKHFYGKILQREGRKMDFPSIDYNKAAKGIKFSDVDQIKMLINLLGDLHQPMHLGFAEDDLGRKVQVKFRGKTVSLFDFWDKTISETVRNDESNFWLGGWTHVRAVQAEFQKDKELFKNEGAFKAFDTWATETVKFACEKAYVHPSSGKKLAGPGAGTGPFEISESDYQQWKEVWLKQVLIAGERTAIVLNDILDANAAAKLKEGAAVKTNADKAHDAEVKEWAKLAEERRKKERRYTGGHFTINPRVILINGAIACVTVPVFLLVVNYGLNPKKWMALVQSFSESDNGSGGSGGGRFAKRFE